MMTADTKRQGDARSMWAAGFSRFRRNPLGMTGAVILLFLYLVAILAPALTPYDPNAHGDIPRMRYMHPSLSHPLGTDKFGRDVLTRVLYGSRISLSISLIAVAISVLLGSVVGAVSGYFGGWVDIVIMRIVDALMSIPRL
ncbi:peptide ABC transporter permease, partial [bacterium]